MFSIEMRKDFIILIGFVDYSLFTNNQNLMNELKKDFVMMNYENKCLKFKIPKKLGNERIGEIIKIILEKEYNLLPYHKRIKND